MGSKATAAAAAAAMRGDGRKRGTRNIKCVEEERFDGTTTPAEMKSFAGHKNCGAGVRYSWEAVGSDWVFSVSSEPHVLTTRVNYEGKGLGAELRGKIYAMLQQFLINSGSGADNIGNMTPSRAMTFVKTINGTLKLSKLDKLFEESHTCHIVTALPVPLEVWNYREFGGKGFKKQGLWVIKYEDDPEDDTEELSKALSRASRLGLRGADAQDLAQRVL
ncbi:hypothetical protein T492DRAFT_889462 [Pavlovales sp. CCMP2436]|nr:hypothetical protein T492DRAFT_889462 [Pavlovales sp. CCMP2436]